MIRTVAAVGAALVLLAGCASTSAKPAFDEVAQTVKARSGHTVKWDQGTAEDKEAEKAIDELLQRELTADAAVQVALLSSPHVRSKLEELAIAQADLVQAGLLKNPVFSIGRTAWEAEHIAPNLFASVEQDFLDVITMPMRKRVAAAELEATKLAVGDEILAVASEVREAFYMAQAAEQVLAMRRVVEDAAKASAELAQRQYDAGNMSDLTLSTELGLSAQTTLDSKRTEGEAVVARERLNKLMGTWGPRTAWKTSPKLPELPKEEAPLDRLESVAIAQRREQPPSATDENKLARAVQNPVARLTSVPLQNEAELGIGPYDRVRNTLGVVRSIVRRTAETSTSVEDLAMHLDGRLNAFARTQALVTRDPGAGVDLEYLVADELFAYRAQHAEQARISGPAIRLQPRAAEMLGLAIHELATNAIKYGSLSAPKGMVQVAWSIEPGEPPELAFEWREVGGPAIDHPPDRQGFGTELLQRTLGFELKATTRLDFERSGLRCSIRMPLTPRLAMPGWQGSP